MVIRAAEGTPNASAAFYMSVGQAGAPGEQDEKGLFITYKDRGGVQQDLTVLRRFDEGGAGGVDFSPPVGQDAATFRVGSNPSWGRGAAASTLPNTPKHPPLLYIAPPTDAPTHT